MMKTKITLMAGLLCFCGDLEAQPRLDFSDEKLQQIASRIQAQRAKDNLPSISRATLESDAELVRSSRAIRETLARKGGTEADYAAGVLWLWFRLRTDPSGIGPGTQLTAEKFTRFAQNLGAIDIQSKPAGATIEIDGKEYPDTTDRFVFETPGTKRVRLLKPGYQTVDEAVHVESRKTKEFHRTLQMEK